jgi:hypothetical protein
MATLRVVREVTEWDVEYRQPNHVYLMQGDRVLAYVPWGEKEVRKLDSRPRLDVRGRRFVDAKDQWNLLSIAAERDLTIKTWQIKGSKGDAYTVSLENDRWGCTCPGHGFRGRCRHVDEVKTKEAA